MEKLTQSNEASHSGLALLRAPFEKHQISLKPIPTKKDNPKSDCKICGGYHGQPAVHLEYVGHAALTDRLLEADINWTWEPLAFGPDGLPHFDKNGGLWIKLTVSGMTRLGYGNAETSQYKEIGSREKEVIGDALRNAAMRFGAALELWHKGDLHGTNESQEEKKTEPKPTISPPSPPKPKKTSNEAPIGPNELKRFFATANDAKIDVDTLKVILDGMYGITSSKELTISQHKDICDLMKNEDLTFIMKLATDLKAKREKGDAV